MYEFIVGQLRVARCDVAAARVALTSALELSRRIGFETIEDEVTAMLAELS
jgi:hypothetical protein